MSISEYTVRFLAAQHAMQSGVALEMNTNSKPTDPKNLRVGVNSAMVEISALAKCLIDKGLISKEEYFKALAEMYELEQLLYEEKLGVKLA